MGSAGGCLRSAVDKDSTVCVLNVLSNDENAYCISTLIAFESSSGWTQLGGVSGQLLIRTSRRLRPPTVLQHHFDKTGLTKPV